MEGRRFNKKLGIKDDKYVHYYHKQVQTFNHLLGKKKKEVNNQKVRSTSRQVLTVSRSE